MATFPRMDNTPKNKPGRPKTGRQTRTIGLSVPLNIADQIELAAKNRGMTISALATMIFSEWVKDEPR